MCASGIDLARISISHQCIENNLACECAHFLKCFAKYSNKDERWCRCIRSLLMKVQSERPKFMHKLLIIANDDCHQREGNIDQARAAARTLICALIDEHNHSGGNVSLIVPIS